jgi:hypothetical protein
VVYEGLREDKPAAEVRRSVPHQTPITKVRGVVRPTFSPKPRSIPRRPIILSRENTIQTVSDVPCETPIKRCDLTLVGGSKCLRYGTGCCRLDILAIAGVVGGLEDVDCSSMEVSRK